MAKCSVPGCDKEADYKVMLYDFYPYPPKGDVFMQQDTTCPHICGEHALENEKGAVGERRPRGVIRYPYTNRHAAQGFTIYLPIEDSK